MVLNPQFTIVDELDTEGGPLRRPRRDWKPVMAELINGKTLFLSDDELNETNIKYLTLAFKRRDQGERIRTQREYRNRSMGRLLWLEVD